MNHLLHVMALQAAAASISSALIASLWQGVALTLATAGVLRLLPRTIASARFMIWSAVFAASAALPLLHVTVVQTADTAPASRLNLDARWSYLLPAIWLAASLFRAAVLLFEAVGLRQIWKTAEPIAVDLLERSGLRPAIDERRVTVCTTPEVDRPSVIGFFAPRILVPTWLFAELSTTEFRHIVLHEMEHLRRRDDWLNLLQKIALVVFPLNLAMFWIDRRLSTEREIACDDGVLARINAPRAYASSLTSIAERRLAFTSTRRMVALALGALGAGALLRRRSEFGTRIESILGQRYSARPAVAAVLVAGVLGGTAAIAHAPDLVTFNTTSSKSAAPASASISTMPDRVVSSTITPTGKFETASFQMSPSVPQPEAIPPRQRKLRVKAIAAGSAVPQEAGSGSLSKVAITHRSKHMARQWALLTSWDDTTSSSRNEEDAFSHQDSGVDVVVPVRRVIVHTLDGRFFVAPYAAVPTQAGWLIVQL